jgi:hypothetical protein
VPTKIGKTALTKSLWPEKVCTLDGLVGVRP